MCSDIVRDAVDSRDDGRSLNDTVGLKRIEARAARQAARQAARHWEGCVLVLDRARPFPPLLSLTLAWGGQERDGVLSRWRSTWYHRTTGVELSFGTLVLTEHGLSYSC